MGDCSVNGRTAVVSYLAVIPFTGSAGFFAEEILGFFTEAFFEATLEVPNLGATLLGSFRSSELPEVEVVVSAGVSKIAGVTLTSIVLEEGPVDVLVVTRRDIVVF